MSEKRYSLDADGNRWEYRLKTSVLEARGFGNVSWYPVTGDSFLRMSPAQLRHVADVIEGVS